MERRSASFAAVRNGNVGDGHDHDHDHDDASLSLSVKCTLAICGVLWANML
jgi:hypothetical protein